MIILLVDDDDSVRQVVRLMLEMNGYTVLEAPTADRALSIALQNRVSLLLSDLMMPGVDGITLARCFRHLQPAASIMLMTGFAPMKALLEPGWTVIQKPFVPAELISKINEVLHSTQT